MEVRAVLKRLSPLYAPALIASVVLGLFPLAASAAEVKLDIKVERKPVVLFRGQPRPVDALIEAMAKKTVGRTDFTISVSPPPLYEIIAERESNGRYRIDPASLALATSATVKARIAIRYPKLSDAQFNALRNTRDYRLLYGLIRGIVEHEQLHAREFTRYARTVRSLYASPPVGKDLDPVIEPGEDVAATLAQYVDDRTREALDAAQQASTARQHAFDHTGKKTRVVFPFTDPVDGDIPLPIHYTTEGKLTVKFEVSKGNPRPPEPRLRYP